VVHGGRQVSRKLLDGRGIMLLRALATALCFGLLACASTPVPMTPEAEHVQVGRSDPTDNYELIGPITAYDGNGCGLYGRRGTYENAINALRVKAVSMGADYVSITKITEPHLANPNCFANPYVISGMVYRKTSESPSPVAIQTIEPTGDQQDLVEKLSELHRLHQAGALTNDEYERAKTRLLK
jgi:hypothetical protein